MTRFGDFHRAEIQGDDVKRRFGRSLHDRRYERRKAVRAVVLYRFQHHRARAVARQRFHQRGRQGRDKPRVDPQVFEKLAEAPHDAVENARRAQNRDRRQHRHQIRNDPNGDVKAFLRAVDERFVEVDLFKRSDDQEQRDEKQNQTAAERFGVFQAGVRRQVIKKRAQTADDPRQPEQIRRHGAVEDFEFLHERDG